MKRDKYLVNLRPVINSINAEFSISEHEKFQNEVIRPIIKFQNNLIVKIFKNYTLKKKINLKSLSAKNKLEKITSILKNDRILIFELKCIIIAFFTTTEYEKYTSMKPEINKRLIQIIRERIISIY